MKVFVPVSESRIEELGLSLGDLVPFNVEYECLRAHEMEQSGQGADQRSSHNDPLEPLQVLQPGSRTAVIDQSRGVSA